MKIERNDNLAQVWLVFVFLLGSGVEVRRVARRCRWSRDVGAKFNFCRLVDTLRSHGEGKGI